MTRLTNEWTKTAEEAFGPTGAKGRVGELFLIDVFQSWGWDVKDYEDDQATQRSGIDLSFKSPKWHNWYTCDVKNNMRDDSMFFVYQDWLFSTNADRIFHVNPNTGWIAYYGVQEMREHYNKSKKFMVFDYKNSPSFVKRRKHAQ